MSKVPKCEFVAFTLVPPCLRVRIDESCSKLEDIVIQTSRAAAAPTRWAPKTFVYHKVY